MLVSECEYGELLGKVCRVIRYSRSHDMSDEEYAESCDLKSKTYGDMCVVKGVNPGWATGSAALTLVWATGEITKVGDHTGLTLLEIVD